MIGPLLKHVRSIACFTPGRPRSPPLTAHHVLMLGHVEHGRRRPNPVCVTSALFVAINRRPRYVAPLGLAGGFLDAAGGGGWGAIVTSNLLVQGATPRRVIGTVIVAEFFLTVTISVTFFVMMGWAAFTVATVGLLIGGILAAPLGALVAKRVPARALLVLVGIILAAISMFGIWRALAG